MPTIEDTIALIKTAHAGQVDKAGEPYYLHPLAVFKRLPDWASEDLQHAALGHDLIEDTTETRETLLQRGYSERTVAIIEGVTKKPAADKESIEDYHAAIDALVRRGDNDMITLKFCDISENFNPERIALLPPEKQVHVIAKYEKPYTVLKEAFSRFVTPCDN